MSQSVRVHIDGIIFSLQRQGGVSEVFKELQLRLGRSGEDATVSLEQPLQQPCESADFPGLQWTHRPARLAERYRACRSLESPASIFHSSYYRLPAQRNVASVVTVHDFAYERCVGGLRARVHRAQKNAAIRRAQAIICVSESTRKDLIELVGVRPDQQIQVVYNGVSEAFSPLPTATATATAALTSTPFVLFVGQRGRYKNFALAVAAMAYLPELELHCVGGGPVHANELAAALSGVRARIKHLGAINQFELNTLYNKAVCLIYPSTYEGFGIPVLEAMRAGCPVVSVACNGVLEVGGQALTVAEPDAQGIAHAVRRTMESETRAGIRRVGFVRASLFSWQRNFEQTMQLYKSLVA